MDHLVSTLRLPVLVTTAITDYPVPLGKLVGKVNASDWGPNQSYQPCWLVSASSAARVLNI